MTHSVTPLSFWRFSAARSRGILTGVTATTAHLVCPRCLFVLPAGSGAKFCPRCGLKDIREAAGSSPVRVHSAKSVYEVGDVLAYGDLCNLHHCTLPADAASHGVLKIARNAPANHFVRAEARALARLAAAGAASKWAAFLPQLIETIDVAGDADVRTANVLSFAAAPATFYTLAEVREHFSAGIDPRDMAWIWRRLINVIAFVHDQRIRHNAVLPSHVLIEPAEHKLILVGWCAATVDSATNAKPVISGAYANWYGRNMHGEEPTDLTFAARCMIDLLGGDPTTDQVPQSVDPAVRRYFERCLQPSAVSGGGHKLLADFDKLIEVLWGARTFRPMNLPTRTA